MKFLRFNFFVCVCIMWIVDRRWSFFLRRQSTRDATVSFLFICRCLQTSRYQLPLINKSLIGHVIISVLVNDNDECQLRCYIEPKCLSYNVGPHMAYGHECELSDSDHVQHPQDLVLMLGYTYIGTKVQSSRCRLSIFNLFDICHVTRCFAFSLTHPLWLGENHYQFRASLPLLIIN